MCCCSSRWVLYFFFVANTFAGDHAQPTTGCVTPKHWQRLDVLGGKLPYVPPARSTVTPDGWNLVKTFYLARHCSRYPTEMDFTRGVRLLYDIFERAKNQTLIDWLGDRNQSWSDKVEQCSACGLAEVEQQGRRFPRVGDSRKLDVTWEATHVVRTQESARAFRNGVGRSRGDFRPVCGNDGPCFAGGCNHEQIFNYSVLRWFKTCGDYQNGTVSKTTSAAVAKFVHARHQQLGKIGNRIFCDIQNGQKLLPTNKAVQFAMELYRMCQADIDVGWNLDEFCSYLKTDDMMTLQPIDNRQKCLSFGPCSPDKVVVRAPCPLIGRLQDWMHTNNAYSHTTVPVHAYFAHEETLSPILTVLKFDHEDSKEHYFRCILGANLRIDMLERGGKLALKAWLNERPVSWAALTENCSHMPQDACPVEVVRDALAHTVTSCTDYATFAAVCGHVTGFNCPVHPTVLYA